MGRMLSVKLLEEHDACYEGRQDFAGMFGLEDVELVATPEMAEKIRHMDVEWGAENLLGSGGWEAWSDATEQANVEYNAKTDALDDQWTQARKAWQQNGYQGGRPLRDDATERALRREIDTFCAMEFLKLYVERGVGELVPKVIAAEIDTSIPPVFTTDDVGPTDLKVAQAVVENPVEFDEDDMDDYTGFYIASAGEPKITEGEAIQVDLMRRGHITAINEETPPRRGRDGDWMF